MTNRTKTPWHVNHDRPGDDISQLSISNGDARIIANVVTRETTHGWDGGSANAAFICKAVNNHDALVDILKIFLGHDERFQIAVGGNPLAIEKMLAGAKRTLVRVGGSSNG